MRRPILLGIWNAAKSPAGENHTEMHKEAAAKKKKFRVISSREKLGESKTAFTGDAEELLLLAV